MILRIRYIASVIVMTIIFCVRCGVEAKTTLGEQLTKCKNESDPSLPFFFVTDESLSDESAWTRGKRIEAVLNNISGWNLMIHSAIEDENEYVRRCKLNQNECYKSWGNKGIIRNCVPKFRLLAVIKSKDTVSFGHQLLAAYRELINQLPDSDKSQYDCKVSEILAAGREIDKAMRLQYISSEQYNGTIARSWPSWSYPWSIYYKHNTVDAITTGNILAHELGHAANLHHYGQDTTAGKELYKIQRQELAEDIGTNFYGYSKDYYGRKGLFGHNFKLHPGYYIDKAKTVSYINTVSSLIDEVIRTIPSRSEIQQLAIMQKEVGDTIQTLRDLVSILESDQNNFFSYYNSIRSHISNIETSLQNLLGSLKNKVSESAHLIFWGQLLGLLIDPNQHILSTRDQSDNNKLANTMYNVYTCANANNTPYRLDTLEGQSTNYLLERNQAYSLSQPFHLEGQSTNYLLERLRSYLKGDLEENHLEFFPAEDPCLFYTDKQNAPPPPFEYYDHVNYMLPFINPDFNNTSFTSYQIYQSARGKNFDITEHEKPSPMGYIQNWLYQMSKAFESRNKIIALFDEIKTKTGQTDYKVPFIEIEGRTDAYPITPDVLAFVSESASNCPSVALDYVEQPNSSLSKNKEYISCGLKIEPNK